MTRTLLTVFFVLLCVTTLPAADSFACHCYFNTPEVEYAASDAVFIGLIVDIQPSSDPAVLQLLVIVNGFWKGVGLSPVALYTNESDAACGYNFEVGTEYLIYARTHNTECCEGLFTDSCTRTLPLSAATGDLEYLGPPATIPVEKNSWGLVKKLYE